MPTETTGPPRNMASEQDDYEDTSAMAVMLRNENAAREAAAVTQIAAEDDGDDWEDVGNERGQDTTDADGAGPQEAEVAVGGNEGDRRVPNAMVGAAAQNVPPLNMDHQLAQQQRTPLPRGSAPQAGYTTPPGGTTGAVQPAAMGARGYPPPSLFSGQTPPTDGIYKAMEPMLCKHDGGATMKAWLKLQRDALAGNADTQKRF